jgi:imidazolonepropionase-like amidohydrolase
MALRTIPGPAIAILLLLCYAAGASAQGNRAQFVSFDEPLIALKHVRIIDGKGAPARENQLVVIDHGKIRLPNAIPPGAKVIDLTGQTVIPGLVGMHEHLFYPSGNGVPIYSEQALSFPRLYLACGITTIRTAGSLEPYTDLEIKKRIASGDLAGPDIDVTGPYLEGHGSFAVQMHELTGPDDARKMVNFWADLGATSFKAYMNITAAELGAAIEEAHKRNIKVTGHLCSVDFREAAALGIDNLEHGMIVDTEFTPGRKPGVCPPQAQTQAAFSKLDIRSGPVTETIRQLVEHRVAITSTLSVFEAMIPGRPATEQRVLDAMSPLASQSYLNIKSRGGDPAVRSLPMKKEMEFERAFVKAGGLLMGGADPTGNGGALAGFGDQRNIELLVEAGFTVEEAIRIYSLNGAQYLGRADRIGSIAAGKNADLVVIQGDPSKNVADIRNVTTVFKDGIGYNSAKLIQSVSHMVGMH